LEKLYIEIIFFLNFLIQYISHFSKKSEYHQHQVPQQQQRKRQPLKLKLKLLPVKHRGRPTKLQKQREAKLPPDDCSPLTPLPVKQRGRPKKQQQQQPLKKKQHPAVISGHQNARQSSKVKKAVKV
jgi:hypothetical protein